MAAEDCPLDSGHCAVIDRVLLSTSTTRELIDKCKKLGMDMTEREAANNAHAQFCTMAKQLFFPNNP